MAVACRAVGGLHRPEKGVEIDSRHVASVDLQLPAFTA